MERSGAEPSSGITNTPTVTHRSLVLSHHLSHSADQSKSSDLTIYPCQIQVHQRWQSKLQLLTARKKEWWPATTDSLPQAVTCQHCETHCVSGDRTHHNLPIASRRATSSADQQLKVYQHRIRQSSLSLSLFLSL